MTDEQGVAVADRTPRYWSYDGEPTLLLGGSVEDNLFQVDGFEAELDELVAVGGNYVRCTMSMRDEGNVQPFARAGDDYDLTSWNDDYWNRFERFLAATADRDVVVQVELWDCWDCIREGWETNAWNPANNVTYTADASGLPTTLPDHEDRFENSFFATPPALDDNRIVRPYQDAFVDRVLDATTGYDHVLYSIDNETEIDPAWGAYWAAAVRERDPAALVTEMWNPWELRHPNHSNTIDDPETYDFVEVSQNNFRRGEDHWAALQACRERVTDPVRPMNNVKIYGADGLDDIFTGATDGVERFWRNVVGGCASARFHRPPHGQGLNDRAKTAIRGARAVTGEIDLVSCEPRNDLLAGRRHNVPSDAHPDRPHEAYVLANPGESYLVYFPRGGEAKLEPDVAGTECRWFDADGGEWGATQPTGDGTLVTPGDGQWIAVVQ